MNKVGDNIQLTITGLPRVSLSLRNKPKVFNYKNLLTNMTTQKEKEAYMDGYNDALEQTEKKKYPKDYTKKQREQIKEIVIARLERLPDNIRISMG